MNLDALFEAIALRLDPDELVDMLGLTTEQLVEVLKDDIAEQSWKFRDLLEEVDE